MTYATDQDFVEAFGEEEMRDLTNLHDATAEEINIDILERNQAKAFALINGMIASCPTVAAHMPFATPPAILVALELDITRYYLDALNPREDVRLRYRDAMEQLRLIGTCEMSLGLPEILQHGSPAYRSPAPVFTRDTLSAYNL
jgi:phage gp36-like protein